MTIEDVVRLACEDWEDSCNDFTSGSTMEDVIGHRVRYGVRQVIRDFVEKSVRVLPGRSAVFVGKKKFDLPADVRGAVLAVIDGALELDRPTG